MLQGFGAQGRAKGLGSVGLRVWHLGFRSVNVPSCYRFENSVFRVKICGFSAVAFLVWYFEFRVWFSGCSVWGARCGGTWVRSLRVSVSGLFFVCCQVLASFKIRLHCSVKTLF